VIGSATVVMSTRSIPTLPSLQAAIAAGTRRRTSTVDPISPSLIRRCIAWRRRRIPVRGADQVASTSAARNARARHVTGLPSCIAASSHPGRRGPRDAGVRHCSVERIGLDRRTQAPGGREAELRLEPVRGGRTYRAATTAATATETVTRATIATRLAARKTAEPEGEPADADRVGEDEERREVQPVPDRPAGSGRILDDGQAVHAISHVPTSPQNASVANAQPTSDPVTIPVTRLIARMPPARRDRRRSRESRADRRARRRRVPERHGRPRAIRVAIRNRPAVGRARMGIVTTPTGVRTRATTLGRPSPTHTTLAGTSRQEW
jgi:hypothetical protein